MQSNVLASFLISNIREGATVEQVNNIFPCFSLFASSFFGSPLRLINKDFHSGLDSGGSKSSRAPGEGSYFNFIQKEQGILRYTA
jgi:hypothetical protein